MRRDFAAGCDCHGILRPALRRWGDTWIIAHGASVQRFSKDTVLFWISLPFPTNRRPSKPASPAANKSGSAHSFGHRPDAAGRCRRADLAEVAQHDRQVVDIDRARRR